MSKSKKLILLVLSLALIVLLSSCVAIHAHSFGEWETVSEPCCGTNGIQRRVCIDCDYEEEAPIQAPEHVLLPSVTAATCTEQGYTTYSCDCGYSYVSDYVKPLGHTLKEALTAPTCTEQGFTHFSCEVCDYEFNANYVEPLAHKNSKSQIFYPTVTQSGYTQYTCLDCEHVYKEDYINYTDILPHAHTDNKSILSKGIDVSYHNHQGDGNGGYLPLDWNALKAAGVDYVILRAGYSSAKDPTFEMDYRDAKAAGLGVGAYFYTYSATLQGTVEDAYDVLSYIEGKQFEYPIYFDLECKGDPNNPDIPDLSKLEQEHLTQLCVTFIEILQNHGYYCGIYINHDWLYNILDTDAIKTKFDIWYARYPYIGNLMWSDPELEWNENDYGKQLGMWQYTEKGYFEENGKKFDLNYCYKDYPEIMKKWHLNGF